MSDIVVNQEDRFSHNEAHIFSGFSSILFCFIIFSKKSKARNILSRQHFIFLKENERSFGVAKFEWINMKCYSRFSVPEENVVT